MTNTININEEDFDVDREFLLDLSIILSQYHTRVCKKISDSMDMRESTILGGALGGIQDAYDCVYNNIQEFESNLEQLK